MCTVIFVTVINTTRGKRCPKSTETQHLFVNKSTETSAFICEQVRKSLQEPLGSVNNLIEFICLDYT